MVDRLAPGAPQLLCIMSSPFSLSDTNQSAIRGHFCRTTGKVFAVYPKQGGRLADVVFSDHRCGDVVLAQIIPRPIHANVALTRYTPASAPPYRITAVRCEKPVSPPAPGPRPGCPPSDNRYSAFSCSRSSASYTTTPTDQPPAPPPP